MASADRGVSSDSRLHRAPLPPLGGGKRELHELPTAAVSDLAARIEKYHDLPMDLADTSLVWLADQIGVLEILTLDERDFGVYRLAGGQRFRNVLADG